MFTQSVSLSQTNRKHSCFCHKTCAFLIRTFIAFRENADVLNKSHVHANEGRVSTKHRRSWQLSGCRLGEQGGWGGGNMQKATCVASAVQTKTPELWDSLCSPHYILYRTLFVVSFSSFSQDSYVIYKPGGVLQDA